MVTTFQFIDNNNAQPGAIDRATRKRIRSHAATGKNVGRKLNRPSRVAALKTQQQNLYQAKATVSPREPGTASTDRSLEEEVDAIYHKPAQAGMQLSSNHRSHLTQGMQATPAVQYETVHRAVAQARAGLDFVLPVPLPCSTWALSTTSVGSAQRTISYFLSIIYFPELRNATYNPASSPSIWLSLVFSDEAYFHIAMAASAMLLSQFVQSTAAVESARASMKHLSRTFQLINSKLASSGSSTAMAAAGRQSVVSDATMAVVIMMAQYERHQGRWFQGHVHLRGLQRMTELRGGITRLFTESPVVGHKVLRLDLEYALHAGVPTYFKIDEFSDQLRTVLPRPPQHPVPFQGSQSSLQPKRLESESKLLSSTSLPPELYALLHDTALTSDLVNTACNSTSDGQRINLHDLLHTLLHIGYRLVHLRPLGAACWVVNADATRPSLDGDAGMTIRAPENERPIPRAVPREVLVAEMVHLGLFAWLLRFMHRLDGIVEEIPMLNALVQRCAEIALEPVPIHDPVLVAWPNSTDENHSARSGALQASSRNDVEAELLLWVLFLIGSVGYQRRPYHPWLVARIHQVLRRLGLDDCRNGWALTRSVLQQLPWVDNLHGRAAEQLWQDAITSRDSPILT